jgi:glutathionylspermidine synthase
MEIMETVKSERSRKDVLPLENASPVLRAGAPLPTDAFHAIRRRALLEHCKWDPQVGDVCTLASFPLIVGRDTWKFLASSAEALSRETVAAEQEILSKPELMKRIGLPRRICKVLEKFSENGPTAEAVRVMRYDFHPTMDGWRISEVNSDVPGGFTEASSYTKMMAVHYAGVAPAGDPIAGWCAAVSKAAGGSGTVALLTAPGFMEDHQIMAYLASHLNGCGCKTHLAKPQQLEWNDGIAFLDCEWHTGRVDAIVRFYQGEWLAKLPASSGWQHFFTGGKTPVGNPGCAIISESKRFPLVWDELKTELPTWRSLLPGTRDPREVPWQTDDGWLLKSALCNTGDTVSVRSALSDKAWRAVSREVRWWPRHWVAQRRFQTAAMMTPMGLVHPCIGVYTINGRAAGAYARITAGQIIDFAAIDIALLVEGSASGTSKLREAFNE